MWFNLQQIKWPSMWQLKASRTLKSLEQFLCFVSASSSHPFINKPSSMTGTDPNLAQGEAETTATTTAAAWPHIEVCPSLLYRAVWYPLPFAKWTQTTTASFHAKTWIIPYIMHTAPTKVESVNGISSSKGSANVLTQWKGAPHCDPKEGSANYWYFWILPSDSDCRLFHPPSMNSEAPHWGEPGQDIKVHVRIRNLMKAQ